MKRLAVISAILENPESCKREFNDTVAGFKGIIKGRMGIPMPEYGVSVISITIIGELNEINSLTGKLGNIEYVNVKTSIAKNEIL